MVNHFHKLSLLSWKTVHLVVFKDSVGVLSIYLLYDRKKNDPPKILMLHFCNLWRQLWFDLGFLSEEDTLDYFGWWMSELSVIIESCTWTQEEQLYRNDDENIKK